MTKLFIIICILIILLLHTQYEQEENIIKNNKINKIISRKHPINPPWKKVIFGDTNYYYLPIIDLKLNDLEIWKQVIHNIDFDPSEKCVIIEADNEETALSIANIILLNIKGDLTVENILSKNLIQVSIQKMKSNKLVKEKIRQQILDYYKKPKNKIINEKMEKKVLNNDCDECNGFTDFDPYENNTLFYL
jgi:hypothetical protein